MSVSATTRATEVTHVAGHAGRIPERRFSDGSVMLLSRSFTSVSVRFSDLTLDVYFDDVAEVEALAERLVEAARSAAAKAVTS